MNDMELMITAAVAVAVIMLLLRAKKGGSGKSDPNDIRDVDNQIRFVEKARFKTRPLMGYQEHKTYLILSNWLQQFPDKGWQLFVQVSYGEILACEHDLAFRSINSKRADFVIVDRHGHAIAVIEYQGSGHYQGNAQKRDHVKATAVRSAGAEFIELFPNENAADISQKLALSLVHHHRKLA